MPYCSIQDLLKEMSSVELAKLTGDPTGANINEVRAEAAIASADALINAYLYGIYSTPLSQSEPIITQIAITLTIFNLNSYYFRGSFVPTEILSRKLDAMRLLENILSGKILLSNQRKSNTILSNNSFKKRYFTEELLQEFKNFRE